MLKLNRKIEYALMALHCLGRADERTEVSKRQNLTAKEIAELIGAPFEVAARVMQTLAHHHWVAVEHGAKGGYQLQKQLEAMTMKDLIEIIDGPLAVVKCQSSESSCEIQTQCRIVSPMHQLNSKLTDFYSSINLNDLLGARGV